METKSAVKVGILVLVGLALGTLLYFYLAHINPNTYKVRVVFDDTRGLGKQSIVRMQGVNIGEVSDVQLDTRHLPPHPVVTLAILPQYDIPRDYQFVIVSGLLITTAQIEVRPPKKPGDEAPLPKDGTARVTGGAAPGPLNEVSPELADMVADLKGTVGDVQVKFDALSVKLNTLLDHSTRLVDTSTETIKSARGIVSDPKLRFELTDTVHQFHEVSRQAAATSKDLSKQLTDLVSSGKGKFNRLSDTAIDLSIKLGNTLDDAREVVRKLTEQVSDPRLQQSLQETVDLARSTLASVRQITSDLHQITGDPTLAKNFSQTVSNFNSASGKANKVLDQTSTLLDKLNGVAGKGGRTRLPKVDFQANISEQFNPARLRLDADARVPFGKQQLFDLGLYDLGENTRLNAQLGNYLSSQMLVRYGLYASKLGVGLEVAPSGPLGLRADLFDPNHPRLDVRGLFRVNKNASVWVGVDQVFKDPVPLIGVQFNP
jgi:phospholipid/cholesterol/gamma-HCH transport system substrate-binding protein